MEKSEGPTLEILGQNQLAMPGGTRRCTSVPSPSKWGRQSPAHNLEVAIDPIPISPRSGHWLYGPSCASAEMVTLEGQLVAGSRPSISTGIVIKASLGADRLARAECFDSAAPAPQQQFRHPDFLGLGVAVRLVCAVGLARAAARVSPRWYQGPTSWLSTDLPRPRWATTSLREA